jgi:ABC-type amino acid transport substrate-binding protein
MELRADPNWNAAGARDRKVRWMCALALSVALTGCSWFSSRPAPTSPTLSAETPVTKAIRVGMASNNPPMSYVDKDGLQGIEADLARKVAINTGMRVTIAQMRREQLVPALQSGRIDVMMAGMVVTKAAEQQVSFVTPYLRTGLLVFIREQDVDPLALPASLHAPGKRFGVVRGTASEQYVRRQMSQARVTIFNTAGEGLRALKAGRIDYFVEEEQAIWRLDVKDNPGAMGLVALYTPLAEQDLAWAVRKGDTKLRDRLDAVVVRMKQNGVIDAIVSRWVHSQVEAAQVR